MAKERNLPSKATLTTSDYIRVVGSDNASYKQGMQSVINIINATNAEATSIADCNNATDPTKIYATNSSTSNKPPESAGYWFIRVGGASGNMLWQIAETMNSTVQNTYVRKRDLSGTWGDWTKQPTRAEVDALNSKISWPLCTDLPLSNCSKYNDIGVQYAVIGNMCHVFISVSGLTANSRVKIATLPTGARPLINVPYIGVGGTSYTSKAYFTVSGGGELYVLSEDTYANGYISFIVK